MSNLQTHLERAVESAEKQDHAAALDSLLSAWRDMPASPIADTICALGEFLAEREESLSGKKPEACQRWLEAGQGQRAEDLSRLLASWTDVPTKLAVQRVELLAAWPGDPRRDEALVKVLETLPYKTNRKFWGRLFKMLPTIRDARLTPRLELLPKIFYEWMSETGDWAQEKLEAALPKLLPTLVEPELPDAIDAALAKINQGIKPTADAAQHAKNEEALLAMVLDAPDNDEARQVYGDLLSERGEPQGELISLQFHKLRSKLTAAQKKREKAIIRDHLEQLVGPLASVLEKNVGFERGFLDRCAVDDERLSLVPRVVGHPLWATVRDFEGPLEIFQHPVMTSLRTLRVLGFSESAEFWAVDRVYERITSLHLAYADESQILSLRDRFPNLEELTVSYRATPLEILKAPIAERLEKVTIEMRSGWRPWYAALHDQWVIVPVVCLEQDDFMSLTFEKDDDGRHTRLTAHVQTKHAVDRLCDALAELDPKNLTALAVTPSRSLKALTKPPKDWQDEKMQTRLIEVLERFSAVPERTGVLHTSIPPAT